MNRQGKGFLVPDDSSLKEIAVPESAMGTAMHEDRVLVRRDVRLAVAVDVHDGEAVTDADGRINVHSAELWRGRFDGEENNGGGEKTERKECLHNLEV